MFPGRSTGLPDWVAASRALEAGVDLASACRAGRLPEAVVTRLVPRWAAAWVDLLDDVVGARVMVADHAPGLAPARLAERAELVAVIEDNRERARFRQAVFANRHAGAITVDRARALSTGTARWDLIVVDGQRLDPAWLRHLTGILAPEGRVVVVVDNALSPLRTVDLLAGRPAGPSPRWGGWRRPLARAGLAARQVFLLLRASPAPVTSFDIDAPEATNAVLQAVATSISGRRRKALALLQSPLGHRLAMGMAPAWLVVAGPAGSVPRLEPLRPTGRMGYDSSEEVKVLRGEPPVMMEKIYATPEDSEREAQALVALSDAGLAIAPRLLRRSGPDRLYLSWLGGRALEVAALTDDELEAWIRRAAEVLARIQHATAGDGGDVLVHGDYWLGNVLAEAERIVGVIDWSSAHRGRPEADLDHLAGALGSSRQASSALLRRLAGAARAAHDAVVRDIVKR